MSRYGQDVTFTDNNSLNNIKRPTWTKLKSSAYSTLANGRLSREDIVAHVRIYLSSVVDRCFRSYRVLVIINLLINGDDQQLESINLC